MLYHPYSHTNWRQVVPLLLAAAAAAAAALCIIMLHLASIRKSLPCGPLSTLLQASLHIFDHSRSFTSIPVINVEPLVNAQAQRKDVAAVAQELHQACQDVGFFYIKNHGVPQGVTAGVLSEARKWFALPEADKQQLLLSPATHYRGYQPLGVNVTLHDAGHTPDWHEAIDFFKEEDPQQVRAAGRPPSVLHGPNMWPDQVPQFSTVLRQYISHCQQLGAALLRGIALGLGLPEQAFGGDFAAPERSYYVLRVIHYPPMKRVDQRQAAAAAGDEVGRDVQLGCGEHCDYGLLTFVNQDPHVTALQVKNAAGQWIDAAPLPGTFVCNIGDMFQVLTNGLYKPTLHRVLNTARETSRVSVPFFYEPCFEAVVAPAPQFCKDRPAAFKPVRYGSHLESKVLNNFEL